MAESWINALVIGKNGVPGPQQLRIPIIISDAGLPDLPAVVLVNDQWFTWHSSNPVTYLWQGEPVKASVL